MLVRVTGWAGVLLATAVAAYAGERAPAHGRSGRAIRRPPGATRDDQFCEGLRPMTLKKKHRRLFGLFSKDEHDKGRWSEFAREHDLNVAVKEEHVFDVAQVAARPAVAVGRARRRCAPARARSLTADRCRTFFSDARRSRGRPFRSRAITRNSVGEMSLPGWNGTVVARPSA